MGVGGWGGWGGADCDFRLSILISPHTSSHTPCARWVTHSDTRNKSLRVTKQICTFTPDAGGEGGVREHGSHLSLSHD